MGATGLFEGVLRLRPLVPPVTRTPHGRTYDIAGPTTASDALLILALCPVRSASRCPLLKTLSPSPGGHLLTLRGDRYRAGAAIRGGRRPTQGVSARRWASMPVACSGVAVVAFGLGGAAGSFRVRLQPAQRLPVCGLSGLARARYTLLRPAYLAGAQVNGTPDANWFLRRLAGQRAQIPRWVFSTCSCCSSFPRELLIAWTFGLVGIDVALSLIWRCC